MSFKYQIDDELTDFEIIDSAFNKDIEKCIGLTKSGISAFLFLIPMGRLLPSYQKSIEFMRDYFNKSASSHVIYVFWV